MTVPPSLQDNGFKKTEELFSLSNQEVPMRKRLIIGVVYLLSAIVVFLLGYAEITFSIRDNFTGIGVIFPAAMLALLGIAQFIKVIRFRMS
jgi:hypothetical protein